MNFKISFSGIPRYALFHVGVVGDGWISLNGLVISRVCGLSCQPICETSRVLVFVNILLIDVRVFTDWRTSMHIIVITSDIVHDADPLYGQDGILSSPWKHLPRQTSGFSVHSLGIDWIVAADHTSTRAFHDKELP